MSAPRNTLSILALNQSDCRPTEVIWTFITFPRVTLLSELVCFHSRQHRCWRIWIIHTICVIYVFAYSWKHKCVCVLLLGRQMKTSAEFRAAKEEIVFIVTVSWNWILFESSFHKRPWPMHVVWRLRGQRKACSAFVSVPDWLDVNLTSSLHRPNNKKGWKARRAPGQGFP